MNPQITLGAAALMGSLVAGTGLVRWAVTPPSVRDRHRSVRAVVDETTLEGLLPPWPDAPYEAPAERAWRWCPNCSRKEPSVQYPDGWHCGHCLEVTVGGAS